MVRRECGRLQISLTLKGTESSGGGERLTFPSGSFGVLMTMALVRGVNLAASSSAESTQSPLERGAPLPLFFCVGGKKKKTGNRLSCTLKVKK